jgi:serine protease Do
MKLDVCSNSETPLSRIVFLSLFAFLLICPLSVTAQEEESIATLKQMGKAFASVAEKASPAVVGIKAERTVTGQSPGSGYQFDPYSDDFFEFFFRGRPRQRSPQSRQQVSQGSGFVISADGYILTNNHVVRDADKVFVELQDGRNSEAEVKHRDEDSDVAILKIGEKDLQFLDLADSDQLEVGEWVLAIGNPLGLSHTVTAGIVSAKHRGGFGLATLENFIQTDAAINFGNSGGPLIDLDGKVVGINTAIAGASGNIGIGFAIPINMAKHIYDQFRKSGKVERGYLGVFPDDLDADLAGEFGLEDSKGALITVVEEGSAAKKAGMQHGDIVLEMNGELVTSANDLRNRIAMLKPGSKVDFVVWRKGKRVPVSVTLDKRESETEEPKEGQDKLLDDLGFAVRALTEDLAQRFGYEGDEGVIVSNVTPGSEASRRGLSVGTLIKEVDQEPVKNVKEFEAAMKKAKKKKGSALLLVKQEWVTAYVSLKFPEK